MDEETKKNKLELLQLKKSNLLKKLSNLHKLSVEIVIGTNDYTEFKVKFTKLEDNYNSLNSCQNEIFKCMISLGLNND